jgi:hypothetical protein
MESELDQDMLAVNGNRIDKEKPRHNLAKTIMLSELCNMLLS